MSHEQQNMVPAPNKFPLILNWVGGLLSLGLIGGLIYWVALVGPYDPNAVPVIDPLKGQARIEPEKPGGALAGNQALAVSAVASDAASTDVSDEVAFAPAPITLDLSQEIEQVVSVSAPAALAPETALSTGLTRSPKPFLRPANLDTSPAIVNVASIAPTIAKGTKLIQLGAYPNQTSAEKQWDKLFQKHGDLLSGKTKFIMVADTSNGRFYRLRASGFENGTQSSALCVALKARNVACFPVTAK